MAARSRAPSSRGVVQSRARQQAQTRLRFRVIQAAEYMVSGGAFFWSGYFAFWVFDKGLGLDFAVAKTGSYLIGWTINFLLQRYWVFKNPDLTGHLGAVTGRYLAVSFANLLIDYCIVAGLKASGVSPYIGQFISAGFFTAWNYLWYRFWVFPEHHNVKARPRRRR